MKSINTQNYPLYFSGSQFKYEELINVRIRLIDTISDAYGLISSTIVIASLHKSRFLLIFS